MGDDGLLWVLGVTAVPVIGVLFPEIFGAIAIGSIAFSIVWITYCKLTGRDWRG